MGFLWVGLKLLGWTVTAAVAFTVLLDTVILAVTITNVLHVRGELSRSMAPKIRPGDLVIYRAETASQIRPGQIISVTRSGFAIPVTHRVLQATAHNDAVSVVMKGDANVSPDTDIASLRPSTRVWRAVVVVRGLGQLITNLTGFNGLIFLLGLMPLFLSLPWIQRRISELFPTAHRTASAISQQDTTVPDSSRGDGIDAGLASVSLR